jgi:hypothetical protein
MHEMATHDDKTHREDDWASCKSEAWCSGKSKACGRCSNVVRRRGKPLQDLPDCGVIALFCWLHGRSRFGSRF